MVITKSKISSLMIFVVIYATGCTSSPEKTGTSVNEEVSAVKEISSPADVNSEAPYLFTDLTGMVYMSWIEEVDSMAYLKFSKFNEDGWSEASTIANGSNWFINWADYPIITTKKGQHMVCHFLGMSGSGTYSYDVKLVHSTDGGQNWNEPFTLHDDGKQAEHGFVSAVPYGDNFFITWLDGRNTVSDKQESNDSHGGHGTGHGAMTVRAAVLTPEGDKIEEWELDNRVCDCCQTSAAITDNGPVVVYRDRSDEEIRDMSIVRLVNGQWTTPESVHSDEWKIAGCPVNGPRICALGNNLAIGWFAVSQNKPQVKIKFSNDGGATFNQTYQVDKGSAIGRVDVEMLDDNNAVIIWMEGSSILGAKVNRDQGIVKRFSIGDSSESRGSGFPQMTKSGDHLIFAWTDTELSKIRTAKLKL